MLGVVVSDVEAEGEYQFERRWHGGNPEQLPMLSEWLVEQQVEEAAMESTAQYWKPVWGALEQFWKAMCHDLPPESVQQYQSDIFRSIRAASLHRRLTRSSCRSIDTGRQILDRTTRNLKVPHLPTSFVV